MPGCTASFLLYKNGQHENCPRLIYAKRSLLFPLTVCCICVQCTIMCLTKSERSCFPGREAARPGFGTKLVMTEHIYHYLICIDTITSHTNFSTRLSLSTSKQQNSSEMWSKMDLEMPLSLVFAEHKGKLSPGRHVHVSLNIASTHCSQTYPKLS